jgi:hypothetical protein
VDLVGGVWVLRGGDWGWFEDGDNEPRQYQPRCLSVEFLRTMEDRVTQPATYQEVVANVRTIVIMERKSFRRDSYLARVAIQTVP